MKRIVLPVFSGLWILVSLACGLPSLAGLSAGKPTAAPARPAAGATAARPTPGSPPAAASPVLDLEKIALQAGDLKPGFPAGKTSTQSVVPGLSQFLMVTYTHDDPVIYAINLIYIFKTTDLASAYFQKQLENAKNFKDSQMVTLPHSLGEEYYVSRGPGSTESISMGWRYHNAHIHLEYIGGEKLSPDEIFNLANAVQTRLAGSPDSLSPSPAGKAAPAGATQATFVPQLQPAQASKPGAGQMVFVSCQSHNSLGMGSQCGIWMMDADGSRLRELTNLEDDMMPSLSPDGSKIVFRSLRRDGNDQIYVINSDGSNLVRLTDNPGENSAPVWSPDGSRIGFMSNLLAPSDPKQIFMYVMGADGSNPQRLGPPDGVSPRWSPDGSQIVFVKNKDVLSYLYIMNADGTQVRVVATNPVANIESPAWSPDGSQIAFLSQKQFNDPIEVDLIGKDGKNQRSLTAGFLAVFGGLSWSPDGQKILFSMRGDGKSLQGALQLYTVNADGSDLHRLETACPYCYDADWGH